MDLPTGPYVVAGVTDSPESLAAAQWAIREAEFRRLPLVLAHACTLPPTDLPLTDATFDVLRSGARAVVDTAMSWMLIPAHLQVHRVIEALPPVALLQTRRRILGPHIVLGN